MAASKKSQPTPTRTFPNTPAGTKAAFAHGQKFGETKVIAGKGVKTGAKGK